jgi:hypothetical protein
VCVSKHSKLLRLPVRKECLDTPDFYQLRCRRSLLILRAAHIIAVFSVSAGSRSPYHIMKNPGVFSSRVLVRYTNIVYQNPGAPGMLFAEPLANSQKDVWVVTGLSIEQNCCFIIVPIIVYLPLQVNLQ